MRRVTARLLRPFYRLSEKVYPRSILQLVVIGFAVVLIPLAAALFTSIAYVDNLSTQSRNTVIQVAEAVRNSRMLMQQLDDMERNARVYQIINKPSFKKAYESRRAAFRNTAQTLLREDRDYPVAATLLTRLMQEEESLHQAIEKAPRGSQQVQQVLNRFSGLDTLVRALLAENSFLVERNTAALRSSASDARYWLFWEATAAVPLAIILCILVVSLLVRPLKRLDRSIRQLGTGDFSRRISVAGPRDVVELGDRLEWMRKRFRELEAQKLNFVRHVSHELKTPLASIREGVGLLDEAVVGPLNNEQRDVTHILHQSTQALQTRIEDLLTFGMSQSESRLQHREEVPFDETVAAVVQEQHLTAQARHVDVRVETTPASVNGDPDQLRIVVDNLLSNAIKYSPKNGIVRVLLTVEGEVVRLEVRDQGPGIDATESERIFEPFYQGKARYQGHVKGSGLGLSIVKQYVRLHEGSIEVAPSARGARLVVRLRRHHE